MNKIYIGILAGINLISISFLFGMLKTGSIDGGTVYGSVLILNMFLISVLGFISYVKSSNKNLKKEIEVIRQEKSKLTEEEKNKIESEKNKKFEENFYNFIYFIIFIIGFSVVTEYWESISNFILGLIFLIFGGIGNAVNGLTSIKGLLILIVILLFVIINKLNNKN